MEHIFITEMLPIIDDGRPSKIYKVGTGLNGSNEGFNYGSNSKFRGDN